ncbi:unnamed protein product, partial [Acidithrix sp. C25]
VNDTVTYQLRGEVAWLTINRPQARNALNKAVREGLFEGFHHFNDDKSARVLVLTGAGDKAFCAGGDLVEMAQTALEIPPVDFVPQLGRNIHTDKVTIAAVNGIAYAGGFLLAQNCDLIVAAKTARFAITEVKVGRGSPWAAPLSGIIPQKVAMEILVTGEPIDALRAYQLGLINKVVPAKDLVEATQRLAETIAANAPLSVIAAKKTARLISEMPLTQAFAEAERIWAPVYLSSDAQEGPRAFQEKRQPNWSGK